MDDKTLDTQAIKDSFKKNGSIRFPLLDKNEVTQLRMLIRSIKPAESKTLNGSEIYKQPDIVSLLYNREIVRRLKLIYQNSAYSVLPDIHFMFNHYGLDNKKLKTSGWHIDAGSEALQPYIQDSDYLFLKVGIYLQDNSLELGGGIDVLPGLHKFPIKTQNTKFNMRLKSLRDKLYRKKLVSRVPIKAGDCVIFSSLLPHRSSPPTPSLLSQVSSESIDHASPKGRLPHKQEKMVIYYNTSKHERHAQQFLESRAIRALNTELNHGKSVPLFFTKYLISTFPDSFPPHVIEALENESLHLSTLQDINLVNKIHKAYYNVSNL